MGLLTAADIKAIEERSMQLAISYLKYCLLFELAPLYNDLKKVTPETKDNISSTIQSNKGKWNRLCQALRTYWSIKKPITLKNYNYMISITALEQDAKEHGLSFNKADYQHADNPAELFLLKSISPAMFTYTWKSQELRTIGAAAGLSAFLCAVVCCPEISTPEIKAIAALFVVPILMCAWALEHHREGQQLMSQKGNEYRTAVVEHIRGIVDNNASSTAALSIVKAQTTVDNAKKQVPPSQRCAL